MPHPFNSLLNFFGPPLTKDGRPAGPIKYRQIIQECYAITKLTNTSYQDCLDMSPTEREFFIEQIKKEADQIDKMNEERKKQLETLRNGG